MRAPESRPEPGSFDEYEQVERCPLCEGYALRRHDRLGHLGLCAQCGLSFLTPRPTQEAIARSYDRATGVHEGWEAEAEGRSRMWQKRIDRVLRHAQNGRALDVGAGFGDFLAQLQTRGGWEVVGTEVSLEAALSARARHGVDVRHGQLDDVGVVGPFDLVTLFHVLEHLPSPGQALRQIAGLLAPGGYVVLALPNDGIPRLRYLRIRDALKRPVVRLMRRPFRSGVEAYFGAPVPGAEIHLSHFDRRTLVTFLGGLGFDIVEIGVDDLAPLPDRRTDVRHRVQEASRKIFPALPVEALFVVAQAPGSGLARHRLVPAGQDVGQLAKRLRLRGARRERGRRAVPEP